MTRRILLSLLMIGLTVAGVSGATAAYFSDTAVKSGNTFSMGTVSVKGEGEGGSDIWQLPLAFQNLIPGQEKESTLFAIKHSGTMPVDFHVGLKVTKDERVRDNLKYAIAETDSQGNVKQWWGPKWAKMNDLLNNWKKIGDNVSDTEWHYYKLYIKPDLEMDNKYQGKTDTMQLTIYAVQHGSGVPNKNPQNY